MSSNMSSGYQDQSISMLPLGRESEFPPVNVPDALREAEESNQDSSKEDRQDQE